MSDHHQTPEWQRLAQHLALEAHPEGGFYKRTYESALRLDQDLNQGCVLRPELFGQVVFLLSSPEHSSFRVRPRAACTAILFLLPAGHVSHLHRIPSDELWHFHRGGPLTIVEFNVQLGTTKETILGSDILSGQQLQHCVPAGAVFGAFPCTGSEFSLVGCTVSPGFEFGDFELCQREALLCQLPEAMHASVRQLTQGT